MRWMPRAGVTLIELPFLVLFVVIACLGGQAGVQRWGWLGLPLGLFAGVLAFLVLGAAAAAAADGAQRLWSGGRSRPPCRRGSCHTNDYDWRRVCIGLAPRAFDHGSPVWVCRCGGIYQRDGRHFRELQADGRLAPFAIWRVARGWRPAPPDEG